MDWLKDVVQAPIKTLFILAGIAFIIVSVTGSLGFSLTILQKNGSVLCHFFLVYFSSL